MSCVMSAPTPRPQSQSDGLLRWIRVAACLRGAQRRGQRSRRVAAYRRAHPSIAGTRRVLPNSDRRAVSPSGGLVLETGAACLPQRRPRAAPDGTSPISGFSPSSFRMRRGVAAAWRPSYMRGC